MRMPNRKYYLHKFNILQELEAKLEDMLLQEKLPPNDVEFEVVLYIIT